VSVHHVLGKEQSGAGVHDTFWLQIVVSDGVKQREASFVGSLAVRGHECRCSCRRHSSSRRSRWNGRLRALAVTAGSESRNKAEANDQTLHTSKVMSLRGVVAERS
jgi:hypothetical protein